MDNFFPIYLKTGELNAGISCVDVVSLKCAKILLVFHEIAKLILRFETPPFLIIPNNIFLRKEKTNTNLKVGVTFSQTRIYNNNYYY